MRVRERLLVQLSLTNSCSISGVPHNNRLLQSHPRLTETGYFSRGGTFDPAATKKRSGGSGPRTGGGKTWTGINLVVLVLICLGITGVVMKVSRPARDSYYSTDGRETTGAFDPINLRRQPATNNC